ncbi:hypothetical protein CHUAL_009160 [Chamberlinius hualienensis]
MASTTSIPFSKTLMVCVITVTVLMLMVAQSSHASPATPGVPRREMITAAKVRQTRGFRNSALSTARGFGKRTSPTGISPLLSSVLADGNTVISAEWLANLMSKNPDVAQLIVDRFVDTDGDGLLTAEELVREI